MKKLSIYIITLVCVILYGQDLPYGQIFQISSSLHPVYQGGKSSAAPLVNGGFVVCWNSSEGSGREIYGQLYNASGQKQGEEFRINTKNDSWQWYPSVAALQNGGFAVFWHNMSNGMVSDEFLSGQFFDSDGNQSGSEIQITPNDQHLFREPQACGLSEGNIALCWVDWLSNSLSDNQNILVQIIDPSGKPLSPKVQVNTYAISSVINPHPVISSLNNGDFVICWVSERSDGYQEEVLAQLFNSQGVKKGVEFLINSFTTGMKTDPSIASFPDGGFVIDWTSQDQDGSGKGIFGQLVEASGKTKFSEFLVNTQTSNDQCLSTITPISGGGFIVCWASWEQDGSGWGVYGQFFNAQGEKMGGELLINQITSGFQIDPNAISIGNQSVLICWKDLNETDFIYDIGPLWGKYLIYPVSQVLTEFSLVEPVNDATLKIKSHQFEWRQPGGIQENYPWEITFDLNYASDRNFINSTIINGIQDTLCLIDNLIPGTTYFWKVLAKNIAGDSLWCSSTNAFFVSHDATDDVIETKPTQPDQFILYQNHPNPFNPETTIRFDLPKSGLVEISIYDISGKLVKLLASETKSAGSYSVNWDGRDTAGKLMPSGIYICWMEAKTASGKIFVNSVKMGLLR